MKNSLSQKAMTSKLILLALTLLLVSVLIPINYFSLFHSLTDSIKSKKIEQHLETISIDEAVGPESFAFDPSGGGPYTGISDGRIIKWLPEERRWIDFATTSPNRTVCEGSTAHEKTEPICGRPLGLCFEIGKGDLFVADAYMGLLVVGPDGGLATPVPIKKPVSIGFANAMDIDQIGGVVYFSDSSSLYQRRNYVSVIVSGDNTGRLMKYDTRSKEITVVLDNLSFPNGVALSKRGDFILVAETTSCRILKLWLENTKAGLVEVFAQLPGFPDNIKRNEKGEFWVAVHSKGGRFFKWILSYSLVRNALIKLPIDITKTYSYLARLTGSGMAMKFGENGEVLQVLEDRSGKTWKLASEVIEKDGNLWIGSVTLPFVVKKKLSI